MSFDTTLTDATVLALNFVHYLNSSEVTLTSMLDNTSIQAYQMTESYR
jgi:hypothetical protein